jgi:hypothetical protein
MNNRTNPAADRSMQDVVEAQGAEVVAGGTRQYRNVRYAHKPFEKLTDQEFRDKHHQRTFREGKTERDHKNGNPARSAGRRAQRAQWQHDTQGKVYTSSQSVPSFPN